MESPSTNGTWATAAAIRGSPAASADPDRVAVWGSSYGGAWFETAVADQVEFLTRHLRG